MDFVLLKLFLGGTIESTCGARFGFSVFSSRLTNGLVEVCIKNTFPERELRATPIPDQLQDREGRLLPLFNPIVDKGRSRPRKEGVEVLQRNRREKSDVPGELLINHATENSREQAKLLELKG